MPTLRANLLGGLLMLTLGCQHGAQIAPAKPFLTSSARAGGVLGLGQGISVSGTWEGTCEAAWVDRVLSDKPASATSCNSKRFALRVTCSAPCQLLDRTQRGANTKRLVVVPLQAGAFEFDASIVGDAPDATLAYHSPTVMVRPPDRLMLMCLYPSGPHLIDGLRGLARVESCDQRPLMADMPWVRPVAEYDGESYTLPSASLNGRTGLPVKSIDVTTHQFADGIVSLTDVYRAEGAPPAGPDPSDDDGIGPGAYTVVLSFGGVSTSFSLNVEKR